MAKIISILTLGPEVEAQQVLGQMRSFQSVGIGFRRPDSGQGLATAVILGKVK